LNKPVFLHFFFSLAGQIGVFTKKKKKNSENLFFPNLLFVFEI